MALENNIPSTPFGNPSSARVNPSRNRGGRPDRMDDEDREPSRFWFNPCIKQAHEESPGGFRYINLGLGVPTNFAHMGAFKKQSDAFLAAMESTLEKILTKEGQNFFLPLKTPSGAGFMNMGILFRRADLTSTVDTSVVEVSDEVAADLQSLIS